MEVFKAVYKSCYDQGPIATSKVIKYLDANPSVRALNSAIERSWPNQDQVDRIEAQLSTNRDRILALKANLRNHTSGHS